MKKINIALASLFALSILSCNKELSPSENLNKDENLVLKTFTASYDEEDTKVSVGEVTAEKVNLVWNEGDAVHILAEDQAPSTAAEATNISGNSAEFAAWTVEGVDTYYAVYPASAVATENTWVTGTDSKKALRVTIPAEQKAVHGSFDPKAYVATAVTNDDHLAFKPIVSAIKFQLGTQASSVEKVVFQINGSTNAAGTGVLYIDKFQLHSWLGGSSTAFNQVTLTKPDDGFQSDTDYYITFRSNSCPSGITLYFCLNDGTVKKLSSNKQLFTSALGAVKSFGDILSKAKEASLKDYYDLGFDIIVAGKSYSPASLGTATLVSESTTISENGVYFIAEGVDVTIANNATNNAYSKLFVIGNSLESKTNVTLSEQVRYSTNGVVGFKNLSFTQYNNDMFVHNSAAEATRFAFDNCDIITPTAGGVMYNAASRTLAEFAMHNCNIKVTKDSFVFIRTNATYSNINIYNNIFYSAEGDKMDFYLINNANIAVTDLSLTQNTFANVYNITSKAGQNPYIALQSVANYTLKNNLFYLEKYGTFKKNDTDQTGANPISWVLSCIPTTCTVDNNMLFKDVNNQRLKAYNHTNAPYTSYTTTKNDVVTGEVDLTVPTIVPSTTAGATR